MDPDKNERERFLFLKKLYDAVDGNLIERANLFLLGENLGFDREKTEKIYNYLNGERLIKAAGLGGWISITHEGIKKIEQSYNSQNAPTKDSTRIFDSDFLIKPVPKGELVSSKFNEIFYDELKEEINKSYNSGIYTGALVLSRKLIENLVIDILRSKYPANNPDNLRLYFKTEQNRFHDFTDLLKSIEEKKEEFGLDNQIIEQFISLVKPFRSRANSTAHSITTVGDEQELLNFKIETMVGLLLRLYGSLRSDLNK